MMTRSTDQRHAGHRELSCAEVVALEARYLAGDLDEATALAIETHAGACADCATRFDASTRIDSLTFSPPIPEALRTRTLAAVATRRASRAGWGRRWGPWGAAAAVLVAVVTYAIGRDGPGVSPRDARVAQVAAADSTSDTDPVVIAEERSRSEFAALDSASRELRAAMAASPEDAELRGFLAAVEARREELSRRVKDAS